MTVNPTYPGVYIKEVPSGVRTISGVATSITAFVGRCKRGPVELPTTCFTFGEFNRRFGGLWIDGPTSYAVDDFFANGGGQALIVRVYKEGPGGNGVANLNVGGIQLVAANPGAWGNQLVGRVSHPEDPNAAQDTADRYGLQSDDLFDLVIEDEGTGAIETFRNLTVRPDGGAIRIDRVLEMGSSLVRLSEVSPGEPNLPAARPPETAQPYPTGQDGDDGVDLDAADYFSEPDKKKGMYALELADIFNILCIPPGTRRGSLNKQVKDKAAEFCAKKRAIFIVDPPASWDANPNEAAARVKADVIGADPVLSSLTHGSNAALYFPRVRKRDPLRSGQLDTFAPCGAVAGIMARTDANRGVWKAPAGIAATIANVEELTVKLNDQENGLLNPIAVNCLRTFPVVGRVVWGSRTLKGSDALSDDYKYVPVRRLALFIEESLYRGTQWVVFEPNDEPLWAQIRLAVGSFMQRLFRQGAFQGASPRDAYFVKCDSETTTQDDINRGIVNIVVGFAPLQPAEFVIISIQQIRSA